MNSRDSGKASKILLKRGILSEDPIENEYENLDEDDDVEDDVATENVIKTVFKAQEPATVTRYDDIKITPFNLEEELEEGEFDKTGNFVFNRAEKSDYDKNDTWAESVDWDAVEQKEREKAEAMEVESNEGDTFQPPQEERSRSYCYKQMLRIMKSDETVQKTIKRIGNEIPKRKPAQRFKTKANPSSEATDEAKVAEARHKLDLMIELAHHLLEDGDTDIYQKTYEQLEEAINS